MAARVMGVYTSEEGIAVAVCVGKKVQHVSWHPSFVQPDGSRLYPAEELYRLVDSLSPDVTVLFDRELSIAPFSVSLPKLKPHQLFQALRIELSSRGVDEILSPVIGFCPSGPVKAKGKTTGVSGFALVAESGALQALKGKYRPLGIAPTMVTLPIFPLAFMLIRMGRKGPALLFLVEGTVIMIARVRDGEIQTLEAFYGDEAALVERVRRHLAEDPDIKIYGFEAATSREGRKPASTDWETPFRPLEGVRDVEVLVQARRPLPRERFAELLARFPTLLGEISQGGIRFEPLSEEGVRSHSLAFSVSVMLLFLLLGAGVFLGTRVWVDREIYKTQKETMTRLVTSVLPSAPSGATLALIESRLREARKLEKRLAPFLGRSSLETASEILPVLDAVGKGVVLEASGTGKGIRVVVTVKGAIDLEKIRETLQKKGKGIVTVSLKKGETVSSFPGEKVYSISVTRAKDGGG